MDCVLSASALWVDIFDILIFWWFGLWCLSDFQQYFSYIVAVSFIGGGNQSTRRKPLTCRKSLTNLSHNDVHLSLIEIQTSVVIGTDCIGSCKSNYRTITAMTAPLIFWGCYMNIMPCTMTKLFLQCTRIEVNSLY